MRRLILALVVSLAVCAAGAQGASADTSYYISNGQWVSGTIGNCTWSATAGQYLGIFAEMKYWGPQCTSWGFLNGRAVSQQLWLHARDNVLGTVSWYGPSFYGSIVDPFTWDYSSDYAWAVPCGVWPGFAWVCSANFIYVMCHCVLAAPDRPAGVRPAARPSAAPPVRSVSSGPPGNARRVRLRCTRLTAKQRRAIAKTKPRSLPRTVPLPRTRCIPVLAGK